MRCVLVTNPLSVLFQVGNDKDFTKLFEEAKLQLDHWVDEAPMNEAARLTTFSLTALKKHVSAGKSLRGGGVFCGACGCV